MAGQMTTIEVDRNTAAILETLKEQAEARGVALDALLKSLMEAEGGPTGGDEKRHKAVGNEAMLAVLARSAERLKRMPFSGSTEDSLKILHEGRAGRMYGYEPGE